MTPYKTSERTYNLKEHTNLLRKTNAVGQVQHEFLVILRAIFSIFISPSGPKPQQSSVVENYWPLVCRVVQEDLSRYRLKKSIGMDGEDDTFFEPTLIRILINPHQYLKEGVKEISRQTDKVYRQLYGHSLDSASTQLLIRVNKAELANDEVHIGIDYNIELEEDVDNSEKTIRGLDRDDIVKQQNTRRESSRVSYQTSVEASISPSETATRTLTVRHEATKQVLISSAFSGRKNLVIPPLPSPFEIQASNGEYQLNLKESQAASIDGEDVPVKVLPLKRNVRLQLSEGSHTASVSVTIQ